jgi:hypothetical protein
MSTETKARVEQSLELIKNLYQEKPLSVMIKADLWKVIKSQYKDSDTVKYWRTLNKEKHGIPVEVSKAIDKCRTLKRVCVNGNVYVTLA